jgi:hypothetical protein
LKGIKKLVAFTLYFKKEVPLRAIEIRQFINEINRLKGLYMFFSWQYATVEKELSC